MCVRLCPLPLQSITTTRIAVFVNLADYVVFSLPVCCDITALHRLFPAPHYNSFLLTSTSHVQLRQKKNVFGPQELNSIQEVRVLFIILFAFQFRKKILPPLFIENSLRKILRFGVRRGNLEDEMLVG